MFEKEKKYFPIKKNPACPLKWSWSTLWLTSGTTNSCHRCLHVPLDKNNFDNFHNLPHKIKERKIMLDGKWPTKENGGSGHCLHCKTVEDANGDSDRMHHKTIPNLYPEELDKDQSAVEVTPKILEVFMNSKCNLKCAYCNTRDSSLWNKEIQTFGPMIFPKYGEVGGYELFKNHPDQHYFFKKTLEYIKKNGNQLRRLHLLGGETFYQKELDLMLDTLENLKNPHLELNIVSNFMVKEKRFKDVIQKIKELCKKRKIGRFDLTASIDGWGQEAEYTRYGLNCEHFENLLTYVAKEKWIQLNINQTITTLTIKSTANLIKKINELRKIKAIGHEFSLVNGRTWMHPKHFGQDFWTNDFENILSIMPEDTERNKLAKSCMLGVYKSLPKQSPFREQIEILKWFLNELDKRRGTNWKTVFPYLDI